MYLAKIKQPFYTGFKVEMARFSIQQNIRLEYYIVKRTFKDHITNEDMMNQFLIAI